MSAIASFLKFPITSLRGLGELASAPPGIYASYLKQHGEEVADYHWSGWVFSPLLEYLEEHHQMRFNGAEFHELSNLLSRSRRTSTYILTHTHKQAYLLKLNDAFSEETLRDFYNEFTESSEPAAGKPMLDGIRALAQSLSQLDEQSVIVFTIG